MQPWETFKIPKSLSYCKQGDNIFTYDNFVDICKIGLSDNAINKQIDSLSERMSRYNEMEYEGTADYMSNISLSSGTMNKSKPMASIGWSYYMPLSFMYTESTIHEYVTVVNDPDGLAVYGEAPYLSMRPLSEVKSGIVQIGHYDSK